MKVVIIFRTHEYFGITSFVAGASAAAEKLPKSSSSPAPGVGVGKVAFSTGPSVLRTSTPWVAVGVDIAASELPKASVGVGAGPKAGRGDPARTFFPRGVSTLCGSAGLYGGTRCLHSQWYAQ